MTPAHPVRRMRGLALIAVLWVIALLSIMAGSFSLSLQRDTGLLSTLQDRAEGLALADGGVQYATLMLSLPDPNRRWQGGDAIREVDLPGGRVRLRIQDEGGKIDINAAQEAEWNALLNKLLGDPDEAAALADAILDWRDPDDLKHLHGAEAGEYQAAGKAYVPTNRNFRALEELQMVLGMSPSLYVRLEPLLTVYTGQPGINPAHASREALLMLPGLDEQTVDTYLAQRAIAPPNAPPPPLPVPPSGITLNNVAGMSYTVYAEALLPGGGTVGLKASLRRQPTRSGAQFSLVDWKPQTAGALGLFEEAPAAPRI